MGCRKLVLQVGQGTIIQDQMLDGITIECYRLKPSITEDIKAADLVISHAGAGSCLGVLSASKPLIVVINEDLMDNHQEELAEKLATDGYLVKSNCSNLSSVLEHSDFSKLKRYIPGSSQKYAKYIDSVMGFSD